MTTDVQQQLGASLIQHGAASDRVYVMEIHDEDMPELVQRVDEIASSNGYGKIFAKVPERWSGHFGAAGYIDEALIPLFYQGREAGHFMAKYKNAERRAPRHGETTREILRAVLACSRELSAHADPLDYVVRRCRRDDLDLMASLYQVVFPSYPFPIHDPSFLEGTMKDHVVYFGAWHSSELVALASAEKYPRASNAEMTDFATLREHRRKGLALTLLRAAEDHARREGFSTTYTIARSLSLGMNLTFAKGGYSFAGTLVNNTQISGQIESMNVWYKHLLDSSDSARAVS